MRINVCVPTRGKPAYVAEYPVETAANAVLPETRVVLGYDVDDSALRSFSGPGPKIDFTIEAREDALGAKYNRCARAYPADLYVLSMDDVAIATMGWDEILAKQATLFKDGIGWIYFGREINGERLPSMVAVTRKVVDLIGFCQEYTPFWWCNTWIDEVANLCGGYDRRVLAAPIQTRYPKGELPEPPRRDVAFWAEFFDITRPMRVEQAGRLIQAMDDGPTAKAVLMAQMQSKCRELRVWNSNLRSEDWATAMAKVPADLDARHLRLRENAIRLVENLSKAA